MSVQPMDAETAETVAGVVRLLRRAAELVWVAIDTDGAGSPRQLLALARIHRLGLSSRAS